MNATSASRPDRAGSTARLPVGALGMALSLFLSASFGLCVVAHLFVPDWPAARSVLAAAMPDFELLTWSAVLLGLVKSYAVGWYIALMFGPIYNFFVDRQEGRASP
ncbi:hypothetical protein K4L06_18090 [Lysobacter sp. BMK333-48F3]|uniref:hypothetical protein n=1 Tax=Lysobacter sp. BMK333-48F3 TaxID=2867962 RepID=UPI001C8C2A38|nr:hypothetical protein [Lysobacter sp. BMK333-48F3]MBX9403225.1 hypothetical protein [Lysobacter sp. BMK333-48F3]